MRSSQGQVLPLALVLIMAMAYFWITLLHTSRLVKDRIQMQLAADTAAQSACAIRARALNSIGRMNSWLGTLGLGIGSPQTAWWPGMAGAQQVFITLVRDLQEAYNRAYGGGRAGQLVRGIARRQGADDIYVQKNSYSLRLQRNRGPIWYLSTRYIVIYGVPTPVPYLPQFTEEAPSTRRWYEQGPDFHRKSLRLYAYRRGRPFLSGKTPDLYAVAAARVYNTRGPMFPKAAETGGILGGMAARKLYEEASERWQTQLIPIGTPYEH